MTTDIGSTSSFPTRQSGDANDDFLQGGSTTPGSSSIMGGDTVAPDGGRAPSDLMGKMVQGAHQTIDKMAEKAAPHVQRLQDSAAGTSDKLSGSVEQMRAMSDEWTDSLRNTVRDNPLAAVATALAVGMLISRMTR